MQLVFVRNLKQIFQGQTYSDGIISWLPHIIFPDKHNALFKTNYILLRPFCTLEI